MKPSEILREALRSFGENGERWVRYCPIAENSECSVTAVVSAARRNHTSYPNSALNFLRCGAGLAPGCSTSHWNDAVDRKFPQVKAAFEKAIELAEREGQ